MMNDDDHIRFRFEHGGLEVDISGPRSFVESISRDVMRDVGDIVAARKVESSSRGSSTDDKETGATDADDAARQVRAVPSTPDVRDADVIWMVRCGELMQRIFMADGEAVATSQLGNLLQPDAMHSLYGPSETFDEIFPDLASEHSTVWGKLTDAGRQQMEQEDERNRG